MVGISPPLGVPESPACSARVWLARPWKSESREIFGADSARDYERKVLPMEIFSSFRQPQFLGHSHEPVHRVRCPIHGFIRFSRAERKIIDHRLFQRLRYIRQLALTELVYPGAAHTRFEHSLGVMEMATRIFDRLAVGNGAQMEATFREVESLRESTMARARQVCRLAALLHDTGHSCFSHAAESVFHEGSDHESLTVHLLTSSEHFGSMLDSDFFEGCGTLAASIIRPDVDSAPQVQLIRDIVSGQVDADRSDYLIRDSHHCGVDYGRFDYRRLIECLAVCQSDETGELLMGVQRDGVHSIESLILARYEMNTQVYYHRLRRIFDIYLKKYFASWDRSAFEMPEKILGWNDMNAMTQLFEDAQDSSRPGHEWASRIVQRRHHREVLSLDVGDGPKAVKVAKRVASTLREEYPDVDVVEDLPDKPISIHKFARDDEMEDQSIDFPLLDQGRQSSLGERSQLVKVLPRSFRIGYLFADVSEPGLRNSITERCRTLRNELRS